MRRCEARTNAGKLTRGTNAARAEVLKKLEAGSRLIGIVVGGWGWVLGVGLGLDLHLGPGPGSELGLGLELVT